MTSTQAAAQPTIAVGGVHTVRRVIIYLLLAITVITAASGISGLLDRLLSVNSVEVNFDSSGLATSLASALIAGPVAALLWWASWREPAISRDRASIVWPLYLVLMSTVALLVATISLFGWVAAVIREGWQPSGLAVGVVWTLVWVWHYWMWRHPGKAPTRLRGAAPAIASTIGLILATGGAVVALGRLVDLATQAIVGGAMISDSVASLVLQPVVWAAGGGLVWWWHWYRAGVRDQSTGFATVLLVTIAGVGSLALAVIGFTFTLSTVLQLVTSSPRSLAVTLSPLGVSVASATVGSLVFIFHARVVAQRTAEVRAATALARSGVALAVAATGIGVVINALLALSRSSIIDGDARSLLLSGLSALVIGGLLWWATWRPLDASTPARAATPGRRIYLVIIFGLSALVALITLLVIGFQLFSTVLGGADAGNFVERSRQALGLFSATVLVAAYHFAVWNRDRTTTSTEAHAQRIERITLVLPAADPDLVDAVRAATGAKVTVLRRTDAIDHTPDAAAIIAALDGVETRSVLVIAGAKGKFDVIPVE